MEGAVFVVWLPAVGDKKYLRSCEKQSVGTVLVSPRDRHVGLRCCSGIGEFLLERVNHSDV